jgi:RNA exonuclease 1
MSYTTAGMECTRVTVVSWNGEIILDELVLPSFPVLDLNTRWSGISDLSKAKLTLSDIQSKIASFCSPETILAGHGLENDLNVLRIIHTCIIDTAFIYPHIKGFPYRNSLRYLVTRYLGRFIQTSASGHDSFEDTISVVQLVKEYLKTHAMHT